ncbi:uncharacterized protein LOC128269836 [Anopheles cruzii]|uniref:uncharacterized protein LOC128269836 n=1 Tax=Anopheles cruzii TaxID=68878 RepID=UPI0022EC4D9A|nr:uncharacterized protein LOC128269836 [Anopheles cruzii]
MKRPSSRDEEKAGPSKRRLHPAQGPAPKSGPTLRNDGYYDYHSDSDPILSPVDLKADREQFLGATQEQREIVVYLVCKSSLICEKSPKMVQQILCTLGSFFPGMVKDPRSVFQAPQWEIKPTNIVNGHGKVVGSFWHRGLEVGIRAQSPLTIDIKDIEYYLHVAKVPLGQPARPTFQAWTVQAQLLDATREPGEPFVVSMLCGNSKPSAPVLLGPVCNEANQLRRNANVKPRAVLADAESRALLKERTSDVC